MISVCKQERCNSRRHKNICLIKLYYILFLHWKSKCAKCLRFSVCTQMRLSKNHCAIDRTKKTRNKTNRSISYVGGQNILLNKRLINKYLIYLSVLASFCLWKCAGLAHLINADRELKLPPSFSMSWFNRLWRSVADSRDRLVAGVSRRRGGSRRCARKGGRRGQRSRLDDVIRKSAIDGASARRWWRYERRTGDTCCYRHGYQFSSTGASMQQNCALQYFLISVWLSSCS